MLEAFEKYVSGYSLDHDYIKLKYNHSVRVMELMIKYAKELNYSDEDIELARLIGLLHDIGRFEQYKVFGSDVDYKTVDHADYSVVQLFDKNQIELFTDRRDWYPIIKFAIKNHNKRDLPDCEDQRVLRFARLIRDIDKMDILYLIGYLKQEGKRFFFDSITEQVLEYVYNHETVDLTKCKNANDWLVAQFAFVFDINNDVILTEYKEYLKYLYDVVNKDLFKEMYEYILKYIDERIDKNDRNRN